MRNTIKDIRKSKKSAQKGNAMIYVLIALALFGFLTITLSGQNNQADGQDIDDEQAEFYAIELMEYAASAQQVIEMMLYTGTTPVELDFTAPDEAGFNTPPNQHKVFHPQGGGLNYQDSLSPALQLEANSGWFHSKLSNVEWTPTTAFDITLNAVRIPRQVCEVINHKITGSKTIPTLTTSALTRYFQEDPLPNDELNSTICPDCVGHPSLCVVTTGGARDNHGYYNIIVGQ